MITWHDIEHLLRKYHGITDDTFKGSAKDIWNLFIDAGWKPPSPTIELALTPDLEFDASHIQLTVDCGNMHVTAKMPRQLALAEPEWFEQMVRHAVAIVRQEPGGPT